MKWTNSKALLALTPISLIILLFPVMIRTIIFKGSFPGSDPYYHLIYNINNPFIFLTQLINPFILSFIFTFLSVIIFYRLLIKFKANVKFSLLASLFFAISPALIYCVVFPTPHSMLLFLFLLSTLLLQSKNKLLNIMSVLLLITSSLFGTLETLIILICLISLIFYNRKLSKILIPSIIFMIVASLVKSFTIPSTNNLSSFSLILSEVITDLGSWLGFSIFTVLLFIIGIFIASKHKLKLYPAYVCLLILALTALFFASWVFIFVNIFIIVFSTYAFSSIMKRKYIVDLIKSLTMLAVIFGLLFSSLSYIHRTSFSEPSKEALESLDWLNKNSDNNTILTHHSYGFWISYHTSNKPFSDDNNKMESVSSNMFSNRNLDQTLDILKDNSIKYIWITEDMKQGLIWSRDEEGLLFLLKKSDKFKLAYSDSKNEIWAVRGVNSN